MPKPPVLPNEPVITDAVYQDQPNIANCKTGTLSEAAKQNMVKRLNLIRALHGLDSVSYDYEHDQEVMQAALIMSANKKLDHAPSVGSAIARWVMPVQNEVIYILKVVQR